MSDEHSRGRDGTETASAGSVGRPRETELVTELFAELGAECVVEAAAPFATLDLLRSEERPAVERAVEKRIREFATGRVLARRALERLGLPAVAIPVGDDRAPRWPSGVVGTITHTKKLCAVACALPEGLQSIGLDVEGLRDFKEGLTERILLPEELEALGRTPPLAYFCAKEAVYKCQYPLSQQFLEFRDVSIAFDAELTSFEATIHPQPDGSPWKRIAGRLALTSEHVIAATALL